jgi:hypothetical protein
MCHPTKETHGPADHSNGGDVPADGDYFQKRVNGWDAREDLKPLSSR